MKQLVRESVRRRGDSTPRTHRTIIIIIVIAVILPRGPSPTVSTEYARARRLIAVLVSCILIRPPSQRVCVLYSVHMRAHACAVNGDYNVYNANISQESHLKLCFCSKVV